MDRKNNRQARRIVFRYKGRMTFHALMLTQNLDQPQAFLMLGELRVNQTTAVELEERAGLKFPAVVHVADDLVLAQAVAREPLDTTSKIPL